MAVVNLLYFQDLCLGPPTFRFPKFPVRLLASSGLFLGKMIVGGIAAGTATGTLQARLLLEGTEDELYGRPLFLASW